MIPYDISKIALVHPERGLPPLFLGGSVPTTEAALAAEAARLAYWEHGANGSVGPDVARALRALEFIDTRAMNDDATHSQGFAAIKADGSLALLALRGSEPTIGDWSLNAQFLKAQRPPWPGQVHRGFAKAATALLRQVDEWLVAKARADARVLVCGHSLGGALALLSAIALSSAREVRAVTFGAPRVGDAEFAREVGRLPRCSIERVTHCVDAVPGLPYEVLGFEHVGQWQYIDRTGNLHVAPQDAWVAEDQREGHSDFDRVRRLDLQSIWFRRYADHAPINYVRAFYP